MGTLYVGTVPRDDSGNLTLRVRRLLSGIALILAQNTGHTERLLDSLALPLAPIVPASGADQLDLLETADVVLLLDGWYSGPTGDAQALVRSAIERGFPVVPLPGSSLPMIALVASGLPSSGFVYAGELPSDPSCCQALVETLAGEARTLVLVTDTSQLSGLMPVLGERPAVVAMGSERGLEIDRWPSLASAVESLVERPFQGKCALVLGGLQEATRAWTEEHLRAEVRAHIQAGLTARDIGPMLAVESGWPRRAIYRLAVEASREPSADENPAMGSV